MLLVVLFSTLVTSRPLGTHTADLKTILHNFAHNADFIHQGYVPFWWFCTIENFRYELSQFDPGTQAMFQSFGAKHANPVFASAPDVMKWWAFEIGILSEKRSGSGMFHFSEEGVKAEHEWQLPSRNPFEDYYPGVWAWDTNSGIDREAWNLAVDAGGYVDQSKAITPKGADFLTRFNTHIYTLLDEHCPEVVVDQFSKRMLRDEFRPECAMLKMLPASIDEISLNKEACRDEANEFAPGIQFHLYMIDWFVSIVGQQNAYAYHDNTHAGMFATTMFHSLRAYRNRHPNAPISDNTLLAATMAGLYHDVGYFLLPAWISKTKMENENEALDKGHELVSTIAAILQYNRAIIKSEGLKHPHQAIQDNNNRHVIAYVILTTKIVLAPKPGPMSIEHIDQIISGGHVDAFPKAKNRYLKLVLCLSELMKITNVHDNYNDKLEEIGKKDEACKDLIALADTPN